MKKILLISIAFLFLFSSCRKDKYDVNRFGKLEGVITNQFGQPIEGALISIESSSVKSTSNGKYSFNNLEVGKYEVMVSKELYLSKIQNTNVIENETVDLDFILESGETSLDISQSVFNVNSNAGNENINITSNAAWVIENKSSWINCSLENGEGNMKLSVSWSKNENLELRVDSILIKSGNISKALVITQDFSIILLESKGIIGNHEMDIKDSILLLFNKPINVEYIKSNWDGCLSDNEYTLVENNYGVRFSYSCAELGGTYPFSISVSTNLGQTLNESINVPFYDMSLKFEGLIKDYILTDDEKNCWVLTKNPNKIIHLSTDSLLTLGSIDLSFNPRRIVINPYNNKLYVISELINYPYWQHHNKIYVFNQHNLSLEKIITIEPDIYDHPFNPDLAPWDINFTSSGYGVLLLSGGGRGLLWRIIESNKNDSIYYHEDYSYPNFDLNHWNKIYLNCNKSKLLITEAFGSCHINAIDQNTQKIEKIIPGSITNGIFIKPHKLSDKIFFGQLYDQFIMDLDGNMSKISYIDNREDGSADFSYRQGESNIIYFLDNDYLRLMDYNVAETLTKMDVVYGLRKINSSIDGKYIFSYRNNGHAYYSELYKFSLDEIYNRVYINQKKSLTNDRNDWIK